MSQLIKKFDSGGTSPTSTEEELKRQALQNSNHDNWRDAYAEYSGKNGSWRERRNFRKDWKNEANVRARVGENTYNQLRATAEQQQFGSLGYNPDGDNTLTREEKRFDRRFNRRLRNGKYDSYLTKSQPTSSTSPTNDYNFQGPLLFNMTAPVFRTAYSFGSYTPAGAGAEDPELEPKTDWNAIAAEKLGEGKTTQDVMALQKQLGITADGKWGKQTQAAYDAYQQRMQNERLMGPTPDFVSPGTYFDVNGPSPLIKHSIYNNLVVTPTQVKESNIINDDNTKLMSYSNDNFRNHPNFRPAYLKGPNQTVTIDGITYPSAVSTGLFGNDYGIKNDHTYAYDAATNSIRKVHENLFGEVSRGNKVRWAPNSEWISLSDIPNNTSYQKQGGKMNKIKYFQQGGKNLPTAPDAKEAYKGGTYKSGRKSDKIIGPLEKHYVPRQITRTISSDTTYVETPKYFVPEGEFIRVKPRKASSSDKDRTEYEILNRRFNEAASVSKKQQGGQMQQQDIQQQIIQLVQAAMQGDQQATQTIQQVMQAAEQGDQQAQQLAQMIQQVAGQMKGQATIAKWGSKLGYIKSLKYAKGGKTCPSCQNEGKSLETSPINKSLKKPIKKVEEKACGGKTKKR